MKWHELCKWIDDNRNRIPADTPIVNLGHFGEVDCTLDGLRFHRVKQRDWRKSEQVNVVELEGMCASYEAPD